MNVIEKIVENKMKILMKNKNKKSLEEIKKEAYDFVSTKTEKFRFEEKLKEGKTTKLIAEYKPASPSKGDITSLKVEEIIQLYDKYPVDMISVLTEEVYFNSNIENFKTANRLTSKPLLRKDFVVDEYMIYESAINNASCILLINGICPDMDGYINICENLGLDAIIECHDIEDINQVIDLNPKIIGINNRNLTNLTVDLETTEKLRKYVPNYLISESGVESIEDAQLLKNYGADAVLIGTSILKDRHSSEIGNYINQLSLTLKN